MPANQTNGAIRVGFVAPCLEEGGAENWQLDLIDAVNANPPARGVTWQGVVVLDAPGNASPTMLAATRAVLPVAFGEDALYSMASLVDVLICWAVYPYTALVAAMASPPKFVFAAHRAEAWSAEAATWLAPASKVVATSPAAAGQVPSSFSAKTSTILDAIDPARLTATTTRAAKRSAWGVPSGAAGVVGFLGRLEAERDPLAMARLANSLPSGWYAVAVGEGSLSASMASTVTGGNLILPGADADAGSCLGAFDWLLSPPLAESFGLSTAEGWYAGVPVIATGRGVAGLHPAYVRTVADLADGPTLAAALAADVADPSGTASRVSSAQSWARSNLAPSSSGAAWSAILTAVAPSGGGGPSGGD